jgi:WD40 repeat protein
MQPLNDNWRVDGLYQLATYTADSTGNLTTTSTYADMPTTEVATEAQGSGVRDYWMSPSGKFLAVAGTSGLQIFHFNGASPITKYTNLIVTREVDQVFWDNSNHLYAIGYNAGKLWVFTVTSKSVTQAPGSPHPITRPGSLIVLPK